MHSNECWNATLKGSIENCICGFAVPQINEDLETENERLRTQLSEALEENNRLKNPQRPIEEAPLDETTVDLWVKCKHPRTGEEMRFRVTDCWFDPDQKVWMRTGSFDETEIVNDVGLEITHYTPIPDIEGEKK